MECHRRVFQHSTDNGESLLFTAEPDAIMSSEPAYTTGKPPQRQTGTIKNRKPAAAGRYRFFRIRQAEGIRAVHKTNLAVKLISEVLKNNYRYSA